MNAGRIVFGICLIAWLITTIGNCDQSRVLTEVANIHLISNAVEEFRKTYDRFPSKQEGLEVLVSKPTDWPEVVTWKSFLPITELPRDRWDNAFVYLIDPEAERGYIIYSKGRDRISVSNGCDDDDINPFNENQSWIKYYEEKNSIEHTLVYLLSIFAIVVFGWLYVRRKAHKSNKVLHA